MSTVVPARSIAGAVGGPPTGVAAPTTTDDEPTVQPPSPRRWPTRLRRVVSVGLLAAGVVAAYGRRAQLAQAASTIGHPSWAWLAAAVVAQASSMVVFARLQRWLLRCGGIRVRLRDMVEITLAGNAMSTSIPGGAAFAAAWIWGQLRRRAVDRVLAGWVVLVAGALASFALFLYVVAGAFLAGSRGPVAPLRWVGVALLGVAVVLLAGVVALARSPGLQRRWAAAVAAARDRGGLRAGAVRGLDAFGHRVRVVTPSPLAWVEALGLAAWNWGADLATLVATILAVHAHVPWRGVVIAYALTQIAASIPITPGGLAVVEASLTALLTAYGMPEATAVTVVLLYRIISFWALVPIGWASWGYLEYAGRGGRRPHRHPWAFHRHGTGGDRRPRRSGPERLRPTADCDGCGDPSTSAPSEVGEPRFPGGLSDGRRRRLRRRSPAALRR